MITEQNLYYHALTAYGTVNELKLRINNPHDLVDWTESNFEYVRYNPRKNIDRWGLSITSLDGGLSGRPDLDSLTEYNHDMGNFDADNYVKESDLNVPTPVYNHPEIKKVCEPWQPHLFRTHILKLNPGGFFPPHRDHTNVNLHSFRLIVPLQNCAYPNLTFMLEKTVVEMKEGAVYFLDTARVHYLFNCSFEPSYWMVMNVGINKDTANQVISQFKIT